MKLKHIILLLLVILAVGAFLWVRSISSQEVQAPDMMRAAHEEVYAGLFNYGHVGGETGKMVQKVHTLIRPHLNKEEEYILPQLGLLRHLIDDKVEDPKLMAEMIGYSEKLYDDLPMLRAEHQALRQAVEQLIQVADQEGQIEVATYAKHLLQHIQDEDDVFYPAAVLVGKYLDLKRSIASQSRN